MLSTRLCRRKSAVLWGWNDEEEDAHLQGKPLSCPRAGHRKLPTVATRY